MAGNQREMQRRERREHKDRRNKMILWILIAVIVFVLIIMKICEININSIKNRFTDSEGNFTITESVVENNFPYNIDSTQNVSVVNINNKLGIITPGSFTVLDSKNASSDYTFSHGYSNPILESAGIYSLIYDQGAKKYRLDTTSSAVYEQESSNTILCADVSKNGTVALATTSKEKICDITVYSKSLNKEFETSTAAGYVVSIAVSDNGKNVAAAVVTGENASLKTTVHIYNIVSSKSQEKIVELPQGTLIDISYAGNNLFAVGDSYAGVIKKDSEYHSVYEQSAISTRCISYMPSGDLILVYNEYNNSTDNTISYVKSSGKIKNEINASGNIKSVTASASLVSILTNNEIVSYNLSNSQEKSRVTVDDSVKSICRLGSDIFIHKQSLIDKSEAEIN